MKSSLLFIQLLLFLFCKAQLVDSTWPPKSCTPPFQLKSIRDKIDTMPVPHQPCIIVSVHEVGSKRLIESSICDSGLGYPTYLDRRQWGYRKVDYYDSSGRNIFRVEYKNDALQGCRNYLEDTMALYSVEVGYEAGKAFRTEFYYKDRFGTLDKIVTTTEKEIKTVKYLEETDRYGYRKKRITRKRRGDAM